MSFSVIRYYPYRVSTSFRSVADGEPMPHPRLERGTTPRLSVIVPATDRPSTLARCVAAIEAAADAPEELVVVDEPSGCGPAQARNAGARRATGCVLVFVDSDVIVHPDAFTRFREAFAHDPDLAAMFGSYDDAPPGEGVVSSFRNLLHHHIHHQSAGSATTFWSGLGAVRRDAFELAGGFDEDRFPRPSVEDVDLGVRLAALGARIWLDPRVQGTHLKVWTLGDMIHTDFFRRGLPWTQLVLKHGPHAARLNLGVWHRMSAGSLVAIIALVAAGRPRLAGAFAVVFVVLNRSFYRLLLSRLGTPGLAGGMALHVVHELVAIAAGVAGVARWVAGAPIGGGSGV